MEWVKVIDKLPDREDKFLVFDKIHGMCTLWYNDYNGCWDDVDGDDYYTDAIGGKVTHWMELPERPIDI